MNGHEIYLYGMIVVTNSFLLQGSYPQPDTYGEIKNKYVLPGGETGTAATVLSGLGCKVLMDGTNMGTYTYPKIIDFYKDKSVDTSSLFLDKTFEGLEDYVIIDHNTRTCFGTFADYYTNGLRRWNNPKEADILGSKVVGLDPWFGEETEKIITICKESHIPYVTIDCPYDSEAHKNCEANVISHEYITSNYPDEDVLKLYQKYISSTDGLVIFTFGADDILYGRKRNGIENPPRHCRPYCVNVVSTLGAGDSFKAGCIYGVLHHMTDDQIVRFAAATAACACTAFPLPLNPPSIEKVNSLLLAGK